MKYAFAVCGFFVLILEPIGEDHFHGCCESLDVHPEGWVVRDNLAITVWVIADPRLD